MDRYQYKRIPTILNNSLGSLFLLIISRNNGKYSNRKPRRSSSIKSQILPEYLDARTLLAANLPFLVSDINPGIFDSSASNLTVVGNTLYFTATDSTSGNELWKINNVTGAAELVSNISSGSGNSDPSNLTNVNGTLYFTANDGTNGIELGKVNNTSGLAQLVTNINPTADSNPQYLTNLNGTLFFSAKIYYKKHH